MLSSHDTPAFSVNPKGIHTLILSVIVTEIPEAYCEYEDVFLDERAAMLAQNIEFDYAIDLEDGKHLPYLPIYNLSIRELEILREYIDSSL